MRIMVKSDKCKIGVILKKDAPIICLIAILVKLYFDEIFDNFSIENFLSLQKEHRKTENENREGYPSEKLLNSILFQF